MGYDVHITRADKCPASDAAPISLEDWLAVVQADLEMRLDDFAEVDTPDGALRYANAGLAVWTEYSGHRVNGNMAWFDYRRGSIVVKNPDDEILAKMKQLAAELRAKVVGEEGEEY